jgi:hypothetical protein
MRIELRPWFLATWFPKVHPKSFLPVLSFWVESFSGFSLPSSFSAGIAEQSSGFIVRPLSSGDDFEMSYLPPDTIAADSHRPLNLGFFHSLTLVLFPVP